MARLRAPLVGRERELEALDVALEDVDQGSARVLVVVGEPGIGKTRLLAELSARAAGGGRLVMEGRASEFERDLPFASFVVALDDYLASLEETALAALGPEALGQLAAVFPALSAFAMPTLQAERYRSYRAVRALLEQLSRPRPVVVILDDVQWADAASVELLAHLLRNPPRGGVLVALAFRPAQLPAPLAAALERIQGDPGAAFLRLQTLSLREAERLVGEDVDGATRADLYRQSGGNPFYLEELTRAASRRVPRPGPVAELDLEVPYTVRVALAAELSGLRPTARRLLEGAAVAGDPFDADLAAVAADAAEPDALTALDELVAVELVGPTEVPRRFRFRHPLLRRAVHELSGAGWRLGAHARLARALADRGEPATARAHHVERSASVGDDEAVSVLAETGRSARDPQTAARWFSAALRLLPDAPSADARRLELMSQRAMALGLAGRFDDAHDLLEQMLERLTPEASSLRLALTVFCANIENWVGRFEDAHQRLVRAQQTLGDAGSAEAATLKLELAYSLSLRGDAAGARAFADDALRAARALNDRALVAKAAAGRVFMWGVAPLPTDTKAPLEEAAALLDALADDEVAPNLDRLSNLAMAEHLWDHGGDSVRHFRRLIDIARATGQGNALPVMRTIEALSLLRVDRVSEADEASSDALEAGRLGGGPGALVWPLAARCAILTCAGALDVALKLGQEVTELARGELNQPFRITALSLAYLGWAYPEALLLAGEPGRARSALEIAFKAVAMPPGMLPSGRARLLEVATAAALAEDRTGEAAAWAAQADEVAAGLPVTMPTVFARRANAAVAIADGDHERALTLAREATLAAESVEARIEAARARVLAGRALALGGHRTEAVDELTRAEADLVSYGAEGYRGEAVRELRRLGRRVAPGRRALATTGVEALTARELEVAELVAANKATREIADALFVSEKTVETHLAHIFAKLGVSSRKAVGPALIRDG